MGEDKEMVGGVKERVKLVVIGLRKRIKIVVLVVRKQIVVVGEKMVFSVVVILCMS